MCKDRALRNGSNAYRRYPGSKTESLRSSADLRNSATSESYHLLVRVTHLIIRVSPCHRPGCWRRWGEGRRLGWRASLVPGARFGGDIGVLEGGGVGGRRGYQALDAAAALVQLDLCFSIGVMLLCVESVYVAAAADPFGVKATPVQLELRTLGPLHLPCPHPPPSFPLSFGLHPLRFCRSHSVSIPCESAPLLQSLSPGPKQLFKGALHQSRNERDGHWVLGFSSVPVLCVCIFHGSPFSQGYQLPSPTSDIKATARRRPTSFGIFYL